MDGKGFVVSGISPCEKSIIVYREEVWEGDWVDGVGCVRLFFQT